MDGFPCYDSGEVYFDGVGDADRSTRLIEGCSRGRPAHCVGDAGSGETVCCGQSKVVRADAQAPGAVARYAVCIAHLLAQELCYHGFFWFRDFASCFSVAIERCECKVWLIRSRLWCRRPGDLALTSPEG